MIILQISDFADGIYKLSTSDNGDLLQAYIDRYERQNIYKLLGITLGDLFIADLSAGTPQAAKYTKIYNQLFIPKPSQYYQYNTGKTGCSFGMKEIMKAIIYYYYVSENQVSHHQAGVATNGTEANSLVSPIVAQQQGERKRNAMIESWEVIQWYCKQIAPTDYPDFDGETMEVYYAASI